MPEELQRVHDKINYETNVVDPKTFAVLLNAVRVNQPLTYEKGRDTVFPQARSAAGMQWDPTKKDTHASGTLEQYGLVIPDENRTITVSDLGYRFLACFDKDYKMIEEEDVYKTILLEMLFAWKETEHGRSIHPGRILFKLLLDKDLSYYTTNHEFAVWTSNEVSMSDRDYLKIKKLILDYRATPYEVAQKKAEVFLRPFANSWDIFDSELNNGTYKFRIKEKMIPLVENFFISKGEKLKADSKELTRYILKNIEPKSSNSEYASVLKGLIARCGGDWDGARIFGVLYHDYVDTKQYSQICSLVGLKESSVTEFNKGKAMGEFVIFKDLLVPVQADQVVSIQTPKEEMDIKQLILEKYAERTDFNWDDEKAKYDKFQSLYSKEVIKALSGKELLYRLFAPKDLNPDSLKYAIEFSKEYIGFGRARVGENHHYFLYLPPNSEKWIKGQNYKTEEEITEDEAIEYAGVLRDKLVVLFDRIEELAPFDSVEKYKTLESEFYSDSFYTKQWVFKYMHMLYPQYFTCWYSWGWLEKAIALVGFKPEGSAWVRNGQISLLANELEIANVFVYRILIGILQTKESVVEEIEESDDEAEESILPARVARTYRQYPLNLILYGAPGTGKTYSTIQLAASIVNKKTDSIDAICEGKVAVDRAELVKEYTSLVEKGLITFTTFHQSYGYEDFIQGLRPDDKSETLRFVPIDGVFKRIVDKAIGDQENNYVIIIDEINRANMSKVLGELITLLETDKRWGEINQLSTKLPSGQTFAVPNNLYVIGTMNSADKSISLIDAALRRRFEFVEVSVNYDTIADATAKKVLKKINEKLESQLDSTDLLVGHAYFIGKDENTLCDVLNHNVIPLLYEYFFDSKAKVKDVLKYALAELPYTINDEAGRRIKVSKN